MNLLEDEVDQIKKGPSKKNKILVLLIFAIVLLVFALAINSVLPKSAPELSLEINDNAVTITQNLLYTDEKNITYISLKQLSTLIGYKYLKGGYQEYSEDESKCYLECENLIIGFEANSNKIYKTNPQLDGEYQYYNLTNKIMQYNNELYIDLNDLNIGCNVVYEFDQNLNKIIIKTVDNIVNKLNQNFTEESQYSAISSDFENQKTIPYGFIVIEDKAGKKGVLTLDLTTTKIGLKYSDMLFDEYTQNFIVSTNGKYGVISKDGKLILDLKYEDISIIKYSPLMYSAKIDGKYGVIDEKGKIIVEMKYDSLGYSSNKNFGATSTLIIKNLKDNQDGIIVKENGKYGIINLTTGKLIGGVCELEAIYSKLDEEGYFIRVSNSINEFRLQEYLEIKNTENVNING